MDFPLLSPEELKKELLVSGRKGLALDIDDTLARASDHWLDFLYDRLGPPQGATREELLKYQFFQNTPFWPAEKLAALSEEILSSNEFQVSMPIISNANHVVNEIHLLVPIVAYITARPVNLEEGTRTWLATHGFPEAPMVLKPPHEDHFTSSWKANVLRLLHPEVVGIIDDNPGLPDELAADYPGRIFIYASAHHPAACENIIPCADWPAVKEAVRRFASANPIQ